MRNHRRNGFTLLELLMVLGIVGVLAAIAIYSFMGAIQRAKQKRSMADIRTIAAAWETRATDARTYNAAGAAFTFPAVGVSYAGLTGALSPTYLRTIPRLDGWQRPFAFGLDSAFGSSTPATVYGIRSAGRDGSFSGRTYTMGPTSDYDCDIVYSSGTFITYPEGVQGKD
jgi:general secretion pathway protein G